MWHKSTTKNALLNGLVNPSADLAEAAFSQQSQEVEVTESDPVHVPRGQAEPPMV